MSQTVAITITTGNEAVQTIKDVFLKSTTNARGEALNLINYFQAAASGERTCSFDVQVNGGASVAASGTITLSSFNTASDTIIINGVTLTCVASGATNNQWNVKASASAQATEIARAINASSTSLVSGTQTASAAGGVVTITAATKGIGGNAITLAKGVDAGSVMTVSGTGRLTGGTATTANVYHFGI
jgi:phage tail sheath gpL-like